ncbi:MAG: transketolase, partial [Tepidisphaeraceae bacterium]
NGHSIPDLTAAMAKPPASAAGISRPRAIIANTTKGKGVSFMEDVAKWHHGVPSDAEYAQAIQEIDAAIATLEGGLR